jgi:hypothetical protein
MIHTTIYLDHAKLRRSRYLTSTISSQSYSIPYNPSQFSCQANPETNAQLSSFQFNLQLAILLHMARTTNMERTWLAKLFQRFQFHFNNDLNLLSL